jgi:hypothetical protein
VYLDCGLCIPEQVHGRIRSGLFISRDNEPVALGLALTFAVCNLTHAALAFAANRDGRWASRTTDLKNAVHFGTITNPKTLVAGWAVAVGHLPGSNSGD